MSSRQPPAIGIPCREIRRGKNPPRYGQNQAYVRAVLRAGGAPWLLPPIGQGDTALLRSMYERCDGLLLPGGEDVDPALYGQAARRETNKTSPDRDEMELALARWAVEEGRPLLAICRGIQVLNVALGGTLYQDIAAQRHEAGKHDHYPNLPRDLLVHRVLVEPGSRLADLWAGLSPDPWVNSLHHQAVCDVAPRLRAAAHALDEIVEAAEVQDHPFALAVQWHPEELADRDPHSQRLFAALVEACRG